MSTYENCTHFEEYITGFKGYQTVHELIVVLMNSWHGRDELASSTEVFNKRPRDLDNLLDRLPDWNKLALYPTAMLLLAE